MQNVHLASEIQRLDREIRVERKKRQDLELAIFLWFCWPYIKATIKWFWKATVFTAKRIIWPMAKWIFSIVTFRSLRNDITHDGSVNGSVQARTALPKPRV